MKIQPIAPSFKGKISISANGNNKNVSYLYNKVSKIVKDNQVTASFHSDKIEITPHTSATSPVKSSLTDLGIEFVEDNNQKETLLSKANKVISSFIPKN